MNPGDPPPAARAVFLLDAAFAVAVVVAGVLRLVQDGLGLLPISLLVYGVLQLWASLGCLGMHAGAMRARRWLGLVAIVAAIWRGGPIEGTWLQVAAVFWTGIAWIAMLETSKVAQRAVAEATGRETLEDD